MTDAPDAPRRLRRVLSVRVRILASMLLVTAAGMAIAGTTAFLVQRERTLGEIDSSLAAAAGEASFIAKDSGLTKLDAVMGAMVQQFRPGTNESTLGIIDGKAALTPGGTVDFRLEDSTEFVERIVDEASTDAVIRGTAETAERTVRYVALPVTITGDARQGIFVIAIDLDAELRPVTEAFRTFALVALAALVAIGLVGWFVAGRLLRPIRRLRETAARITATDLSERIPVVGSDDVSELTETVNGMLDRLDGAITSQRQLLDDVGHELKTPITIVRGHLELMAADDAADVNSTRELAIDELDRMSGLVRDISALAEVQRPMVLTRTAVDVAALTERVRRKAAAMSTHEWVVAQAARVTAELDADRISQALLQLAANAVKHGSPAGRIEIGSRVQTGPDGGERLAFWVADEGPGVDEAAQAHIFERFGRASVGRGTSGSGLGLAIVSAIAKAHGGTASVESAAGAGARFTIDMPLVTA